MPDTKTLTLKDILTTAEIKTIARLWDAKQSTQQFHRDVIDQVLRPAMPRINERLGQENDMGYLAYVVEYVMMQSEDERR